MMEEEYGRPRRPNPESIAYLRGLPLDEALAYEQVCVYCSNQKEEKEEEEEEERYPALVQAAHTALSSIQQEVASLACEETSSFCVETLIRMACRYSKAARRVVAWSCRSYWVFLSCHRFGSHVAQTALNCAAHGGGECQEEDLDERMKAVLDDAYGDVLRGIPPLEEVLLETVREIKPYAAELMMHVCGTHVLRTLLCILARAQFVDAYAPNIAPTASGFTIGLSAGISAGQPATRRGKLKTKKRKKKSSAASDADEDASGHSRQQPTSVKPCASLHISPQMLSAWNQEWSHLLSILSLNNPANTNNHNSNSSNMGQHSVQRPGELQHRACHPSAGPLLVQLIRLLSYRDATSATSTANSTAHFTANRLVDRRLGILPHEPRYTPGSEAESFVHRLLCWDPAIQVADDNPEENNLHDTTQHTQQQQQQQPYAGDVIYTLSGEPRGSILLETILRTCHDAFHEQLCTIAKLYDETSLRDYISHNVSNYVIQSFFQSVRNRKQVERIVKCLCGIIQDGSILMNISNNMPSIHSNETLDKHNTTNKYGKYNTDETQDKHNTIDEQKESNNNNNNKNNHQSSPKNNPRMGVIWRAFEMCATKGSPQDQEQLIHALLRGYAMTTTTVSSNHDPADNSPHDNKETKVKQRKKRSKTKGLTVQECIPLILGLTPTSSSSSSSHPKEDRLTLNAPGARTLFHIFHFAPRLRSEWVRGFIQIYDGNDLVRIANDGLGSRCIMDALLDGPAKTEASPLLLPKLSPHLPFLSTERIGHHTILKLFDALPTLQEKAIISAQLSQSLNRLGGNSMGRSVMAACAIKEYFEGEVIWKKALESKRKKEEWLRDIVGNEIDENETNGESTKRKRKKMNKKGESMQDKEGVDGSEDVWKQLEVGMELFQKDKSSKKKKEQKHKKEKKHKKKKKKQKSSKE